MFVLGGLIKTNAYRAAGRCSSAVLTLLKHHASVVFKSTEWRRNCETEDVRVMFTTASFLAILLIETLRHRTIFSHTHSTLSEAALLLGLSR